MIEKSVTDLSLYRRTIDAADLRSLAELPDVQQIRQLGYLLEKSGIAELLKADGLAVLGGLEELDERHWRRILVQLCRSLGELLPQSANDHRQLVREVRFRGGDLRDQYIRYSDSRSGGSFHTDGVPIPGPLPDLVALLCVRQARSGGELVFIESHRVLERAARRMPQLVTALNGIYHFDQRRSDRPRATVARRMLETSWGRKRPDRLVYLRDYVESGHSLEGIRPLSKLEIEAMNVLDSVMQDEQLHVEGRLLPGQIALSDNHRYLHGRHAFFEGPDPSHGRLMLRCWIRRASR